MSWKQPSAAQLTLKLMAGCFFKKLGQYRQVGYRAVVGNIILVQARILQQRCAVGLLKQSRYISSAKRAVYDLHDARCQQVWTFFKQPCWNRIKHALLQGRLPDKSRCI